MKKCLSDVCQDINILIQEKQMDVDGETVNLEIFLCGDCKLILLLMGLTGATSNYSCVWCKLHKNERWNMKYELDHCNKKDLRRKINEIHEYASKKTKENYCCKNAPLINIETLINISSWMNCICY